MNEGMAEGKQLVVEDPILSEAASMVRKMGMQSGDVQDEDVHGEDVLETDVESDACNRDEAVEDLVREHARLVYRIGYAVLRSHHDAEDATQETFLRVLRYSRKLDRVEDPKTWLARIAWRVAVDRSQRHRRQREVALEENAVEEACPEAMADQTLHGSEVGALIGKLIAALPDKLRQSLILSTLEEMSPREVAATLGINEAAVRSRVFRARQILREKLAARATGK
jgi:RNA polymerase sigma-70 factor (ECF subfamily)